MSFYHPKIKLEKKSLDCLFLDQVEIKERKDPSSFHQNIQSHKTKIRNYYASNPDFAEIIKYRNNSDTKQKKKSIMFSPIIRHESKILSMLINKPSRNIHSISLPKINEITTNKDVGIYKTMNFQDKDIMKMTENDLNANETNEQSNANLPIVRNYSQQNINMQIEIDNRSKPTSLCLFNSNNKGDLYQRVKPNIIAFSKSSHRLHKNNNIQLRHRNKLKVIYERCKSEITRGESIDHNINKSSGDLDKKIIQVYESKKKITTVDTDKMIITDTKKKNSKYDLLRNKNIEIIKKRINQQVSEGLAYTNKKNFLQGFNKYGDEPYQLLLIDLIKEEENKSKRRRKEDSQLELINNILDLTVKDKEKLKTKIDIKDEMYKKENYVTYFNKSKLRKKNNSQNDIFTNNPNDKRPFDCIEKEVHQEIRQKYYRKKSLI